MKALGDFIGGRFESPVGEALVSRNPARNGQVVLETAWDASRAAKACEVAAAAAPAWAALSLEARWTHLQRFRAAIEADAEAIAEAITLEMGKLRSEARIEVRALIGRFALVLNQIKQDLAGGPVAGFPDEVLRFRPHGVVGVIGPFNFPLHLCHAHAIPALLTGNAVVVKPSDMTPLCGQRYAEAAMKAGLPPGVLNVVLGRGAAGAALTASEHVRGLCFTGSWPVGRRILEDGLDRPELLVALEMGGKNTVIVLDDADIRQAAHDIVVGGYLTTGQRCTCTDRVLVQRGAMGPLMAALRPLVASIKYGDPNDDSNFAGPLANEAARDKVEAAIRAARAAGADAVIEGGRLPGGAFLAPSLHVLPEGVHDVPGYTDEEIFGPDLCIEVVEDEAEAAQILAKSRYGLANSVFTASGDRFEHIYRETSSGLLNWNRTTNQASPRLPFGGTGRSGNFRPAGAYAPRNTVVPVAVKKALPGELGVHPKLAASLVDPDLDALEAQHAAEEAAEAARDWLSHPRPMGLRFPKGGALPTSEHWRSRFYAGGRFAKEKKPGVFDHLRSVGPWMVSVDEAPLSTLDAMSQTATVCGGFSEDPVAAAYAEGVFGEASLICDDTSLGHPAAEAYADVLRTQLPALPHVSFTNSGAEANEKAFALCRLQAPEGADRVVVFEGSFHGRTLLSLHSTWNPVKREPFQIAGYESTFAPFPLWTRPMEGEPEPPMGFLEAAGEGRIDVLTSKWGSDADALLAAEVASLSAVGEALATGRIFAVSIEPMQSEGGDRYATARFFKALRLLTRHHGAPLIFDEVQTGFGLGGSFFWHSRFGLVDKDGNPDHPDAVVIAKRAQVGVCMSRFEDPELTSTSTASLIRGRLHAEMMIDDPVAARIEAMAWPRLVETARRFPDLVHNPRSRGYAFAFDLPDSALLAPYYSQRFWRGAVVFGAGSRTVRYRLSTGFGEREIDMVFDAMRRSLAWLEAHPGQKPPVWEDLHPERPAPKPSEVTLRTAAPNEVDALMPAILALEARVYEPARRDPESRLRQGFTDPDGVAIVAELDGKLVGSAVGAPLESIEGKSVDTDPMAGHHNTLHSIAISVAPEVQGQGVGRKLKAAQIARARAMTDADGAPRYRYITGRNRVGFTDAMMRLNKSLGAHTARVLTQQYGDPDGQAVYYRIPVRPLGAEALGEAPAKEARAILADGIGRVLTDPPASLVELNARGGLSGPTTTKITICNYITPAVVRAVEWVCALIPELPYLYLTSGRDEAPDKAIRTLRYHRKAAQVAIGFEGGYFGHTSAGARSLTDPGVHREGPTYFDWPLVPHPARVGTQATLDAIRAAVKDAGGPDKVLGIFAEPVQERTGHTAPDGFWAALDALRSELDLPLVIEETATACYRSGHGPFISRALGIKPDILMWWAGGQTGHVHLGARYFISKPLAMVSTWDGDELSMIRLHHQLRALRSVDQAPAMAAMGRVEGAVAKLGLEMHGEGLYRIIDAQNRGDDLHDGLAAKNVVLRAYPGGRLAVAPRLDTAEADLGALADALEALAQENA